jgi:hypothetical protein
MNVAQQQQQQQQHLIIHAVISLYNTLCNLENKFPNQNLLRAVRMLCILLMLVQICCNPETLTALVKQTSNFTVHSLKLFQMASVVTIIYFLLQTQKCYSRKRCNMRCTRKRKSHPATRFSRPCFQITVSEESPCITFFPDRVFKSRKSHPAPHINNFAFFNVFAIFCLAAEKFPNVGQRERGKGEGDIRIFLQGGLEANKGSIFEGRGAIFGSPGRGPPSPF